MIVAYSSKAQCGKDTAGEITQMLYNGYWDTAEIISLLGQPDEVKNERWLVHDAFEIKKFAEKVKEIVCILLNCTREQLEDNKFKETELGQEWWYYDTGTYNKGMIPYPHEDCMLYTLVKLTPRRLLQLVGTEAGRDIIHPNIWVNSLMAEYKGVYKGLPSEYIPGQGLEYPNWVITDMRFPNELKAVKAKDGATIRISRNVTWDTGVDPTHRSETSLDNAEFDYYVDNNGTLEEFIDQLKRILIREKLI